MFALNEKYEIIRNFLKYDYIRYSLSEKSTINTANSQIDINIPKEDRFISLPNSYLDLNFDVLHAATGIRFEDNDDIRLVNLCPSALFSKYKLTTSSRRHLEDINHAPFVSLLYKLITSVRHTEYLSIDFDLDRSRKQRELCINKTQKVKYHFRLYLKSRFGFAEQQEKANHGLGYKITITRNTDNAVLNKDNAINNAKNRINAIEWYVPHYTPSISNQVLLSNQILSNTPTEIQ